MRDMQSKVVAKPSMHVHSELKSRAVPRALDARAKFLYKSKRRAKVSIKVKRILSKNVPCSNSGCSVVLLTR